MAVIMTPLEERIAALKAKAIAKRGDPLCTACVHKRSRHEGMLCLDCVYNPPRPDIDPIHEYTRRSQTTPQHAATAPTRPTAAPKPTLTSETAFQWATVTHIAEVPYGNDPDRPKLCHVERVTNSQGQTFIRLRVDRACSLAFTLEQLAPLTRALAHAY